MLITASVAARYFGGNLVLGQRYMEQHCSQKSPHRSGFNLQSHALTDTLAGLFATFCHKGLHAEVHYVTDSYPEAVCYNTLILRCTLPY